jgi:hypothetical protein
VPDTIARNPDAHRRVVRGFSQRIRGIAHVAIGVKPQVLSNAESDL